MASGKVSGKVRVNAWIPRELYEELVIHALRKHGRVQRSISKVVVEALERYLKEERVKTG